MSDYPKIPHPRMPIRRTEDGSVIAECQHCGATKFGRFPAEIELDVRYHRDQHRRGAVEATRAIDRLRDREAKRAGGQR